VLPVTTGETLLPLHKAKTAEIASIRLWETRNWRPVDVLMGHSLTVTQISFSPDDMYMLSVSRDRNIVLYEKQQESNNVTTYSPIIKHKAHDRIVWACSWSFDGKLVITGSRDKTVKVWRMDNIEESKRIYQEYATRKATGNNIIVNEEEDEKPKRKKPIVLKRGAKSSQEKQAAAPSPFPLVANMSFESPVTACEFVNFKKYGHLIPECQYMFAVGMENGNIVICRVADDNSIQIVSTIDTQICHVETVRRLRWRQVKRNDDEYGWQLISCSTDNSIRLFDL